MGLTLVTPATEEPLSVDDAKAQLRLEGFDNDDALEIYIPAAREWAEGATHKKFVTQTWDYTIDWAWSRNSCNYAPRVELPLPPLQSVTSVTYVDTDGATQTLAADQYVVHTNRVFGLIVPAYGITWPAVRCQPEAITVRMVCGFGDAADVPADVKAAMLLHVEMMFDRDPQSRSTIERARDDLIAGNVLARF